MKHHVIWIECGCLSCWVKFLAFWTAFLVCTVAVDVWLGLYLLKVWKRFLTGSVMF